MLHGSAKGRAHSRITNTNDRARNAHAVSTYQNCARRCEARRRSLRGSCQCRSACPAVLTGGRREGLRAILTGFRACSTPKQSPFSRTHRELKSSCKVACTDRTPGVAETAVQLHSDQGLIQPHGGAGQRASRRPPRTILLLCIRVLGLTCRSSRAVEGVRHRPLFGAWSSHTSLPPSTASCRPSRTMFEKYSFCKLMSLSIALVSGSGPAQCPQEPFCAWVAQALHWPQPISPPMRSPTTPAKTVCTPRPASQRHGQQKGIHRLGSAAWAGWVLHAVLPDCPRYALAHAAIVLGTYVAVGRLFSNLVELARMSMNFLFAPKILAKVELWRKRKAMQRVSLPAALAAPQSTATS